MPAGKVECLNPNTGARMNIDAEIYDLFVTAIKQTLKGGKAKTFSEMVEGIRDYFLKTKNPFSKSVAWYAITIKNDMEVRGQLQVFAEKGKKLNKLGEKNTAKNTEYSTQNTGEGSKGKNNNKI